MADNMDNKDNLELNNNLGKELENGDNAHSQELFNGSMEECDNTQKSGTEGSTIGDEQSIGDRTMMDITNTVGNLDPPNETTEIEADTVSDSEVADEIRRSARNRNDIDYALLDNGEMPKVDQTKPKAIRKNSVAKDEEKTNDGKTQKDLEKEFKEAGKKIKQLEATLKTRSQMVTTKNARITAHKNEIKATEEELKTNRDELKKAKDEIVTLENEVSKLRKLNNEKDRVIQANKDTIRTQQDAEANLTKMLNGEKQKNGRVDDLEKSKKETTRQLEESEKEMSQTLQENIDLADKLEQKGTELKKTQKQLDKRNREYEDLKMKYIKSQETNQPQTAEQTSKKSNQKTALLIADSNGKRINPKLPRNDGVKWQHIRDVYRAVDIPKQFENEDAKQLLNRADSITIMVGLNEIRDGKNATDILKSIEDNTLPLISTNKPIIICEIIPVANDNSHKIEADCLNDLLKRLPQKYPNVTILKSYEELDEYEPHLIFETDLFHLDKDKIGTTIMAQKIMDLTKIAHQDTPAKKLITEKIEIMKDTAQHYIGTSGKTLKKLTTDHQVNIAIPRDANEVIVTGTQENVKRASQEILTIKENINRKSQHQHQNYRTQDCTYYQKGACRKGDKCSYRHASPKKSRSRSNVRDERNRNDERQEYDQEDNRQSQRQHYSQYEQSQQERSTERRDDRSRAGRRHHEENPQTRQRHSQYGRRSRSTERRHAPEQRRSRSAERQRNDEEIRNERTHNTDRESRRNRSEHFYAY